ncbi:putative glucosyltransferase [metagenome]|uniref:Putative glucosyltransferase n=1 Tax=metagenome TaxID=256318 RepID=A0A2P2CES2_9ZZZZ
MSDLRQRLEVLLADLYPTQPGVVLAQLLELAEAYRTRLDGRVVDALTQRSSFLITYGDSIRRPGETPLHTLRGLLDDRVGELISDVHLLPMFPWTSDDGFAVVDHRLVNPDLGDWDDVADLAEHRSLMFDFVANHTSSSSPWFQGWLDDAPAFAGFYVERDLDFDVSNVVRPRTSALFHQYDKASGGSAWAWTTFGADQVDVDVRNPAVLLELTDVLLGYLARGASSLRLDAIGFLWKESGTTCLHLPQTHAVIKIWRALVDHVAPGAQLITETNVPHRDNISYFGDGHDEATMVYQFALPPLVLHSFVSGSTERLSTWAASIGPVSDTATWFNFLASHDGVGLRPTEGILDDEQRQALVERTRAHGGEVSMAARADGGQSVYELNVSYLDALCSPEELLDEQVVVAKALAAHSILLSVLGVPAIYIHSLLGSHPDHAGMASTGIHRRINRAVLDADALLGELTTDARRSGVFAGILELLAHRRQQPGLSPYGSQEVLRLDDRVFAVRRGAATPDELVCVTNVTADTVVIEQVVGTDVLAGRRVEPLVLPGFGFAWVSP